MKAETAAILAVFGYLRNSDSYFSGPNKESESAEIGGLLYTRISFDWQDQLQEYLYTISLNEYNHDSEHLQLEIRTQNNNIQAQLKREATRQYSISFSDSIGDNSDVVPWFKIDSDTTYIHDGYHQNADAGEEGPFTGRIELDGLRSILSGYYNDESVEYVVEIEE